VYAYEHFGDLVLLILDLNKGFVPVNWIKNRFFTAIASSVPENCKISVIAPVVGFSLDVCINTGVGI